MDEKTNRRFTALVERANTLSLKGTTALTQVEEDILHLKNEDDREGAQSILLRSQDALQMFPPGFKRRFYWIACLPLELPPEQHRRLTPAKAVEFRRFLMERLADFDCPVTSDYTDAHMREKSQLNLCLHSLERCSAETRAWIAFFTALHPNEDECANFSSESFALAPRYVGLFLPLHDPQMTLAMLQNPSALSTSATVGKEIEKRVGALIEQWSLQNPHFPVSVLGPIERMSDSIARAEQLALKEQLLRALEAKVPLSQIASAFKEPLKMAIGTMRAAEPFPGQMVAVALCDSTDDRMISFGFASLLAGTPLSIVATEMAKLLSTAGINHQTPQILPAGPLIQRLDVSHPDFRIPCPDGAYRPLKQAFYGMAGRQIKSFGWDLGWKYRIDLFASDDALRDLVPLPHPIAMKAAGAESAMRAHYEKEILDVLHEQMSIPGRCQATAMDKVMSWCPGLQEIEDDEEDAVWTMAGIYAAEHQRLANGALLIVKKTLITRLNETDFEDKFPAKYIRSPYADAFFHFETPLTEVHKNGNAFMITGFYVSEESAQSLKEEDETLDRLLAIKMTYRYSGESIRFGAIPVHFSITKDDERSIVKTYSDAINKQLAENPVGPDDREEFGLCIAAMELIMKVLVYANMKAARLEFHDERSKLSAQVRAAKGSSKDKLAAKLRRVFDYILLGPEDTDEDRLALDLTSRKMKVHWRKGFFRNQRHGHGLSLTKQVWIAPTLVNSRDLGGNAIPEIPPYVLE